MVAAGVGDKVGISLWIIGSGRYEAANFGNGLINENDLVWNWTTTSSNYQDVFRATQNSINGGRAWITEYAQESTNLQYRFFGGAQTDPTQPNPHDDWVLATNNDEPGTWVTKIRSDLLASFLDSDLQLQPSAQSTQVSNQFQVQNGHETGTRPSPNCPGGRDTPAVIAGSTFACSTNAPSSGSRGLAGGALAAGGIALALAWRRRRRS
jgi:hypothetical protein